MAESRVIRVRPAPEGTEEVLRRGIEAIQAELEVTPTFPAEVEQAAADAAAAPRLPALDRTDLPMVTVDPPGAQDLDQALYLRRDPDDPTAFLVHYAIADVAAFVAPGDPVDQEARRRGETLYGADSKVPLHPPVLSEDAASLLPDQVRPALLWTIKVDATGEGADAKVERALVRSRAQLTYDQVQRAVDDGSADETLLLLREVGQLRLERETARGGVSLPLPEQDIDITGDDWMLEFRSQLPAEQWNAQISLLTGFAAASLMVQARVGLLRTLPPPDPRDVQRLHRTARALHIDWPDELSYPDFIHTLDPTLAAHAAMVVASTRLLRGSGYVAFDGEVPADHQHGALASAYAHVTAPLRRLCDRFTGEVCVALCAGTPVPAWVLEALPELPSTMRRTGQKARAYENAVLNLVEAGVLSHRVGAIFDAVVVDVDEDDETRGSITIAEPAIEAKIRASRALPLGTEVQVRLVVASVEERRVGFELV